MANNYWHNVSKDPNVIEIPKRFILPRGRSILTVRDGVNDNLMVDLELTSWVQDHGGMMETDYWTCISNQYHASFKDKENAMLFKLTFPIV